MSLPQSLWNWFTALDGGAQATVVGSILIAGVALLWSIVWSIFLYRSNRETTKNAEQRIYREKLDELQGMVTQGRIAKMQLESQNAVFKVIFRRAKKLSYEQKQEMINSLTVSEQEFPRLEDSFTVVENYVKEWRQLAVIEPGMYQEIQKMCSDAKAANELILAKINVAQEVIEKAQKMDQ